MQLFIKPDNLVSAHFGTGGVLELDLGNKEIPSIVEAYGQLHRERGCIPLSTKMRRVSSYNLLTLLIQLLIFGNLIQ